MINPVNTAELFRLKHCCSKVSDGRESLFSWDRKTPRFEKAAQKSIFAPGVMKHRGVLLIRKSSGDKSCGRGILEHQGPSIKLYFRDRIFPHFWSEKRKGGNGSKIITQTGVAFFAPGQNILKNVIILILTARICSLVPGQISVNPCKQFCRINHFNLPLGKGMWALN